MKNIVHWNVLEVGTIVVIYFDLESTYSIAVKENKMHFNITDSSTVAIKHKNT